MLSSGSQSGFTLIEMMVAIVILAVLLTIGMPSMTAFIQNGRIRAATEALNNGLQLARAEAVRRNELVRFDLGGQTDSSWSVFEDATSAVIQSRTGAEGSTGVSLAVTPSGANRVTFNGLGQVKPANSDGTAPITQMSISIPGVTNMAVRTLQVFITTGGQIRTCDPMFNGTTDPRACQ